MEHTARGLFSKTQHYLTNFHVRFEDPDLAYSEAYVLAFHRLDGDSDAVIRSLGTAHPAVAKVNKGNALDAFVGGRHVDQFERRDSLWRIKWRRMVVDWSSLAPSSEWSERGALQAMAWPGTRDHTDPSYWA